MEIKIFIKMMAFVLIGISLLLIVITLNHNLSIKEKHQDTSRLTYNVRGVHVIVFDNRSIYISKNPIKPSVMAEQMIERLYK